MNPPVVLKADDLGLVSCGRCDCDLLGERTAERIANGFAVTDATLPPAVGKRVRVGKRLVPLCEKCLVARREERKRRAAKLSGAT